jgi:hypothetical protein
VRSLLLKAAATVLTIAAATAGAVHVGLHLKTSPAPLHPAVVGGPSTVATTAGGRLTLTPSVRSGNVQAVTSTNAS